MFGNFIEEECTGDSTLALAGATSGNIAFQEKFIDGQEVFYFLVDSGGTIEIAGLGTYVSATDDITRDDFWSWNGTTYDDDPDQTNVTLSGGTHTIRCDASSASISNSYLDGVLGTNYFYPSNLQYNQNTGAGGGEFSASAGRLVITTASFSRPVKITEAGIYINTTSAGGNARVGLYECLKDGSTGALIFDSGDLATDAAGAVFNTLSSAVMLPAGDYYLADYADNTTVTAIGVRTSERLQLGTRQGISTSNDARHSEVKKYYNLTYGAFPSTLGTPDGEVTWATLGSIYR